VKRKPFRPLTRTHIAWLALVFIAAAIYLFGLGSVYAPTNGDEMVYIHIARMTAESGHWLPLQSEIMDTRNTKPPLLFWQAIAAGQWGQHWSLVVLRLPSIAYTFATAALVAFFTFRISKELRTACLAAVLYLLFFSTFRYGRVYLTSAPETFWLSLPMWWVLWLTIRGAPAQTVAQPVPSEKALNGWTYTLYGVAIGLGCAYKSFALAAPTAAALWCAILLSGPDLSWPTVRAKVWHATLGVTWSTVLAVGIFALWFVLDPDPAAVWQEFVVAENAGKMSGQQGYWYAALFGAYPMWTQLLAYPENAGLLFFPVLGLGWFLVRRAFKKNSYASLPPVAWVLLAWLVVWLVVFTIPSQRSARYVIPAMPALAMVMALVWYRLANLWFWITLAITVPALVMLARIGWVMNDIGISSQLQLAITLIAACAGLAGAVAGFVLKNWLKGATLVACLAVYATFSLMVEPFSAAPANYSDTVVQQVSSKRIGVPNGFTGQFERFHFVLPGATLTPYDAEGRNTGAFQPELPPEQRLVYLLAQFDAVVWLQEDLDTSVPSCNPGCTVLGERLHVKSRHKSGEITWTNLWYPQTWLFGREWLVVNTQR
jgi:4-amino-4-deoxy-L-arabinose transferase-like glycosyltransferase